MRRYLVLAAVIAATLTPIQTASANGLPVKCYTRNDSGVLFTACSDGFYAYTHREGRYKVSVWQSSKMPKWKVVCRALNTRDMKPAPRCDKRGMYVFGQQQ